MPSPLIGVYNQPSATPQVDWNHPLAHDLMFFLTNTAKSFVGSNFYPQTDYAYGQAIRTYNVTTLDPSEGITFAAGRGASDSTTSGSVGVAGYFVSNSDQSRVGVSRISSRTSLTFVFNFDQSPATNAFTLSNLSNFATTYPSGTNAYDAWVEGSLAFSSLFTQQATLSRIFDPSGGKSTSLFLSTTTTAVPFKIFGGTGGSIPAVSWAGIWKKKLNENEIAMLHANPYCMLRY